MQFTDIKEIPNLLRKYKRESTLVKMMKDDEKDGLYEN